MRTFKQYMFLYLKGLAMGAADIVPGVSGGTIAFISGIYNELLASISAVKPSLFSTLKKEGLAGVWKEVNANFLIVLLLGIATSVLTLAKLIEYLLHYQPILLWAFFFGLILASIIYIGKEIKRWNVFSVLGLLVGAAFVVWLSVMPPFNPQMSYLFLFFAGMIAICAMILPGISGSFILLIMGAYAGVVKAISDKDLLKIATVGLGAVVGLLAFSNLLKWLLAKYNNTMMAVLTGFLIGSLWKIWPWKQDEFVYVKEIGVKPLQEITSKYQSLSAYLKLLNKEQAELYKSYVEHNILPTTYEQVNNAVSNELFLAMVFCVIGFSIIFILERIAIQKKDV